MKTNPHANNYGTAIETTRTDESTLIPDKYSFVVTVGECASVRVYVWDHREHCGAPTRTPQCWHGLAMPECLQCRWLHSQGRMSQPGTCSRGQPAWRPTGEPPVWAGTCWLQTIRCTSQQQETTGVLLRSWSHFDQRGVALDDYDVWISFLPYQNSASATVSHDCR